MEFEEDIKRWVSPGELSQLEEITRRLLGNELDKTVDEALMAKAQAEFEPFAKTLFLRKELEKLLAAISPPLDDACRYLNEEELKLFQDSLRGAVAAYLGPRWLNVESSWRLNPLAGNYEMWLSIIKERRQEEQRRWRALEEQLKAPGQAIKYSIELNAKIEKFRQQLHPEKEKLDLIFSKRCQDSRYLGYELVSLLEPDERRELKTEVMNWIRREAVPDNLAPFIICESEVKYFPLVYAEYDGQGKLPALDFMLESYAVVQLGYWLQPTTVKFSGIPVAVPLKVYKDYGVEMKSSEFLGYADYVLTPDDLRNAPAFFWQSVPLDLVVSLMNGKPPPKGAVILDASDVGVTYEMGGQEIDVPNIFADYLLAAGKGGGLFSLSIIPAKVAEIIEHLPPMPVAGGAEASVDDEVVEALVNLGWKKSDVKQAVAAMTFPENASLEEKVKLAVQNLGGGVDKDKT